MKNKIPKIKPRGSWILIKPANPATQNEYGLTIPDSVEKEQKAQGEIIATGPKVLDLELQKGRIVIYGKFAGEEIQIGKKHETKDKVDYVLLLEEDILAILE
jgi:chaperonin GroES